MADDRNKLQSEILLALAEAKKQVAALEKALAQNSALLGTGVELIGSLGAVGPKNATVKDLLSSLEIVENEDGISKYLGSENNHASRPRIGSEASDEIRPKDVLPANARLVRQVITAHPDDILVFDKDAPSEGCVNKPFGKHISQKSKPKKAKERDTTVLPAPSASQQSQGPVFVPKDSWLPSSKSSDGDMLQTSYKAVAQKDVASREQEIDRVLFALHTSHVGIFDWQIGSGHIFTSETWRELFGEKISLSSPVESMTRNFEAIDSTPLWQQFETLFSGAIDRFSVNVRIRREEAPWLWGRLSVVCLRDDEMLVQRLFATLIEIAPCFTSEQKLKGGQETASFIKTPLELLWRFDSNLTVVYASASLQRYFTFASQEAVGKTIFDLGLCQSMPGIEDAIRQVFQTGRTMAKSISFTPPKGIAIPVECRFIPDLDVKGEVVSVAMAMYDQRYLEREAKACQHFFSGMADGFALFAHMPPLSHLPTYAADEFVLLSLNSAFAAQFSIDENVAVGSRLPHLLGVEAETWAEKCLRRAFEQETTVISSFNSSVRNAYFEVNSYLPSEGKVACIVKDTTKLHSIMQDVRLNESRFAALYRFSHMDSAPEEEVVQFSLDQAVQLTRSLHGFLYISHPYNEEAGKTYWSREVIDLCEEEKLPAIPEKFLLGKGQKKGKRTSLQRAIICNAGDGVKDVRFGKIVVHSYMVAPVIEDGKIVCIAGVANKKYDYESSDLRQLELFINGMWFQLRRRWSVQTLQRAKDEAEAASRVKNEFLANVSHELRTPLNGILGMLQLLQQSPLSPAQLEYVVTANYSGRSLLRIISDILDFSRIEAGRLVLEPQVFDFTATVRSTLGMFIHQAEQKKIKFILRIANNIPKFLLGDDSRVRQIIFNLVGNAFKFTDNGAITIECSLLPYSPEGKHVIYFSVKDTGVGIPESSIDIIFNAFTQLDGSSTRRYAGTGLGLGIVRRLILLMQGNLCLESEVGVGTTIHCSIPFQDAPEQEVVVIEPVDVTGSLESLDILVAEDDPINRLTIKSLLLKQGHKVVCVNDGRQALEALLMHQFDCLITDIQMPNMDGVEVASRIRDSKTADIEPSDFVRELLGLKQKDAIIHPIAPDIPIVALTAHAMAGDKDHFIALGMDYYLSKPILVTELKSILRNIAVILHSRRK